MHIIFNKKNNHLKNNGFIALISVIIISFVLLLVSTTLTLTGFSVRFDILNSEFKKVSENIADGCIESARLILAQNNDYTGDVYLPSDLINSSFYFCKIIDSETIIAHSKFNDAETYFLVKLDNSQPEFPIKNFTECANYDLLYPNTCQSF